MSWDRLDPFEHETPYEDPRPCEKCIHRVPYDSPNSGCQKGCGAWECAFEEKPPMTLEDALEIMRTKVEIDYGDRDEIEIDEIDEAIDLIIAKAKAYMKRDTAEWNDYIDGRLGVKTYAGICSKCGQYNSYKTKFCPWCGRQMKEVKKGE